MEFSPQQAKADEKVSEWYSKRNQQVFYLGGYAGTGKSTIARHLADRLGGRTVYAAYTGKAAVVMRKSGCDGASTIHSTIYKAKRDEKTGKYKFIFDKGGACADANLIVIDECSMVGQDIGKDLLRYGKPILVLGDPAQLPPVKSGGFFTDRDPDVMLTEIHRQAEGNPIIQLASQVRQGKRLRPGRYGNSEVLEAGTNLQDRILKFDQVLVGKNRTRELYNERLRVLLDRKGLLPVPGDRLVCLKNDHSLGIFNGGIYRVESASVYGRDVHIVVQSEDFPDADYVEAVVRREFFEGGYEKIFWKELAGYQQFTYGYALTVHKSQGSQWDKVCLFNEAQAFESDWQRWLYTGITRAAEQIVIA